MTAIILNEHAPEDFLLLREIHTVPKLREARNAVRIRRQQSQATIMR